MKPILKKPITLDMLYMFDFETVVHDNVYNKLHYYLYSDMVYECAGNNFALTDPIHLKYKLGENKDFVVNQLLEIIWRHKIKWMFFHNFDFDGEPLLNCLERNGYCQTLGKTNKKRHYQIVRCNDKILGMKIYHRTKNERLITTIHCSYRKTNTSVAEMVGGKGERDHLNYNFLDIQDNYCLQDIITPINHIKDVYFSEPNFDITRWVKAYTSSQWAFKPLLEQFDYMINQPELKDNYQNFPLEYTSAEYDRDAPSYYGGSTFYNLNYQNQIINIQKTFGFAYGVQLDINSSYPYQMTRPLPYKIVSQNVWSKLPSNLRTRRFIIRVKNIQQKHHGISFYCKKKTKFPYEQTDYAYVYHEHLNIDKVDNCCNILHIYENKLAMYEKLHFNKGDYEILETIYYELRVHPILAKNVNKLINERRLLENELKNPLLTPIQIKIIKAKIQKIKDDVNSFYGKLAQKYERPIVYTTDTIYQRGHTYLIEGKKYRVTKIKNHSYGSKHTYELISCYPIQKARRIDLAAYITSEASCLIFKHILLNLKYWMKTDTDSEFFGCPVEKLHPETQAWIDYQQFKELGKFKVEYQFTDILIPKSKAYQGIKSDGRVFIKAAGFKPTKLKELALANGFILHQEQHLLECGTLKEKTDYGTRISEVIGGKLFSPDNFYHGVNTYTY